MVVSEAKNLNTILKGIKENGKKKVVGDRYFNFDNSKYSDLSPENQNVIFEAVMASGDERILEKYIYYLNSSKQLGNLSSANIATLMEKLASKNEECYNIVSLEYEGDLKFSVETPNDFSKIAMTFLVNSVPKEKRLDSIIKMLPYLSNKEKLIAYSSIVSEEDREQLESKMAMSKEEIITTINSMLEDNISREKIKSNKIFENKENQWEGMFVENIIDTYKERFTMDEMTNLFEKRRDYNTRNWIDLLIKNSKRVSPSLLFDYICGGYFTEEQSKEVIESNLKRFDYYAYRQSHEMQYVDQETKRKFYKFGETHNELIETIENASEDKRFEFMIKAKDYLYNSSVARLIASLPNDKRLEALEKFKDHLTKMDVDYIYEYYMSKDLQEERRRERINQFGSTSEDDLLDLQNLVADVKTTSGMGR